MGIFNYLNKNRAKNQSSTGNTAKPNKEASAIRLFYVSYETFIGYHDGQKKICETYGISSPFKLPNGMSIEDACKVVSYLSDFVEKGNNLEPACEQSVRMVSNILEKYGFSKVEGKEKGHYHAVSEYIPFHTTRANFPATEKIEGVVDLFSVGGDFKIFKKTDLYDRYFEWYTEGVTKQEVANIYKNLNNTEEFGHKK